MILPSDWREVPGQSPRQYRRRAEGAGVLQLKMYPPKPELSASPDTLLIWLQTFIRDSIPELDEPVYERKDRKSVV